MGEINESDRFECKVVNVIDNMMWKGVVVEELRSEGRVYFGRVEAEGFDIKPDDTLYIGAKLITSDLEEKTMEVTLYDADDNKLDWTIL